MEGWKDAAIWLPASKSQVTMQPRTKKMVSSRPAPPPTDRVVPGKRRIRQDNNKSKPFVESSYHLGHGRRKTKFIVIAICSIGLLYHLVMTTVEYFSYEMVTSTSISSPEEIIPPAMSFCLYIRAFDQLDAFKEVKCNGDYYSRNQSCLNRVSLNSLMNNHTRNISYGIDFFEFGAYKKISDKSEYFRRKTFHYYSAKYKCLVIPGTIGSEMINDYFYKDNIPKGVNINTIKRQILENNFDDPYILDYKVNMEKVTNTTNTWLFVTLFFHDAKMIGHNRDYHFVRYFWDKKAEPNVARLNYQQITTKYLKYPFQHKCHDYSKDGNIESKGHCHELCTHDGLLNKHGSVGRVVSTTVFDDNIPYDSPSFDTKIDLECTLKCRLDCKSVTYTPILDFLWKNAVNYNSFRVQWISSYPQTFISFSAKLDLLEYFIFTGGIFGMWLGLDVLIFASSTFDCVNIALKKWLNKV